jgi:hypothetical protein
MKGARFGFRTWAGSFPVWKQLLATQAPAAAVFIFSESSPGKSAYYRLTSR